MNIHPSRPLRRSILAMAAVVTASTAVIAGGTPTASAARCNTPGHAYLTQPGRAIFSGYEGNQQFGVPTVTFAQGTPSFRGERSPRDRQPSPPNVDARVDGEVLPGVTGRTSPSASP